MECLWAVCVAGKYTRDTQVLVPDERMNDDDFDPMYDGEWTDADGSDLYLGVVLAEDAEHAIRDYDWFGWEPEVLIAYKVS